MSEKKPGAVVREVKRRTRRKSSAEEKIATVLEGLRELITAEIFKLGLQIIINLCQSDASYIIIDRELEYAGKDLY